MDMYDRITYDALGQTLNTLVEVLRDPEWAKRASEALRDIVAGMDASDLQEGEQAETNNVDAGSLEDTNET